MPLLLVACSSEETASKTLYQPTWESLADHEETPDWFRDAKFGIYLHFGPMCVAEFGNDWYPRNMHFKDSREYAYHTKTFGPPEEFGYHDLVPLFTAQHFNAEEWADLFQKSGARFAGLVAEHHDGFSMWASKVNPWNAKDMGPHKDLVGQLERAIHERGMRFVTSFHMGRNLQVFQDSPGGQDDRSYFPYIRGLYTASENPLLRILYGNIPKDVFYANWTAKLHEVIEGYHPDLIYFDGMVDNIPETLKKEFAAFYFNRAQEWGKDVTFTHKGDFPDGIGIHDFEMGRMNELTPYSWLSDDTISTGSWSYTKDLELKNAAEIIHVLVDIVSKNGSLLLNISPRPDGVIPDDQRAVLGQIGDWLATNGEAIFDTRPWLVYGEGPTKIEEGGNFVERTTYTPQDIRYTAKANAVYAITLGAPRSGQLLVLSSFAEGTPGAGESITHITLLGQPEEIAWKLEPDGLHITTPEIPEDAPAVSFKIETQPPVSS